MDIFIQEYMDNHIVPTELWDVHEQKITRCWKK